ncbi:hypothetical protein F5Y11DRAFT_252929 [Daldinia sp. FL1419]|nr:hypothetical protein F5Y11DRAFT_252929 [Daldinia sp. FL1419]
MLVAGITNQEAEKYLRDVPTGSVVIACINSPKSVTLSGDVNIIDKLERTVTNDGKFARKLCISTAYHSPHMVMIADACMEAMVEANINNPKPGYTMMSPPATRELIDHKEPGLRYRIINMCNTVRFSEAVQNLLNYSANKRVRRESVRWDALVEVGPHSVLRAPLMQIMKVIDQKLPSELCYTSILTRGKDATTALKAAGRLWSLGSPISLERVNRESLGRGPSHHRHNSVPSCRNANDGDRSRISNHFQGHLYQRIGIQGAAWEMDPGTSYMRAKAGRSMSRIKRLRD